MAVGGGALIHIDPLAGVVAIAIPIAIVFAVHGVTQVAFALEVRRQPGWHRLLVSSCIALVANGLIILKLPFSRSFTQVRRARPKSTTHVRLQQCKPLQSRDRGTC